MYAPPHVHLHTHEHTCTWTCNPPKARKLTLTPILEKLLDSYTFLDNPELGPVATPELLCARDINFNNESYKYLWLVSCM